ncbi:hypothetical protein KIN20_005812 [Parelaphostrongylus tenuis]|uniref:Uncharacterized protein n=1 Tax=Parelaphostrongylus tenuis TaxID=148309 RepID=A0AAD5QKI0_PARTN|nr:hypothetical protein KIN20_005812 [Parelaphostrongylus tenuis]
MHTTVKTVPDTTTLSERPRIHVSSNTVAMTEPSTGSTRIVIHPPSSTKGSHLGILSRHDAAVQNSTTFNWPSSSSTSTLSSDDLDDFTIVTALIDIGRGEWDRYRRPLEQYHIFMENLLSLQNNMVIFTDKASYDFIRKYRKNMGELHRTKIHLITLGDLPLSPYLDLASKLIQDEHRNDQMWRYNWDPSMKDHPESRSAEYDVLVNSKTYFLYNASTLYVTVRIKVTIEEHCGCSCKGK